MPEFTGGNRVALLRNGEQYFPALRLFYGERLNMGAIALQLGFKRQDEITRLLDSKVCRSDIRRLTLHALLTRLRLKLLPHQSAPPILAAVQSIDAQLAQAGWLVQDREDMNLTAGDSIAVREFKLEKGDLGVFEIGA